MKSPGKCPANSFKSITIVYSSGRVPEIAAELISDTGTVFPLLFPVEKCADQKQRKKKKNNDPHD